MSEPVSAAIVGEAAAVIGEVDAPVGLSGGPLTIIAGGAPTPECDADAVSPAHLVTPSPRHAVTPSLLENLAPLLEYPGPESGFRARAAQDALWSDLPEAAEALEPLRAYLWHAPLCDAQELYTRTFDLNPACSLDVSYYLFGEDYRRGVFLAHLRESQEDVGVASGGELPDHLPTVLRWLARVYAGELYAEMLSVCLRPALRRIDQCLAPEARPHGDEAAGTPHRAEAPGISSHDISNTNPYRGGVPDISSHDISNTNPYRGVVRAVALVLERDAPPEDAPAPALPLAACEGVER